MNLSLNFLNFYSELVYLDKKKRVVKLYLVNIKSYGRLPNSNEKFAFRIISTKSTKSKINIIVPK